MKHLKKVKIIIRWQIIKNFDIKTLKIDQLTFIPNFFESENMTNYNFVNIPMKTRYFIDMQELRNFKEVKIKPYQQEIG